MLFRSGKNFTVKAEKELTVAEAGGLVVNASIDSAPAEVIVGNSVDLRVSVDVETEAIESVVWSVKGEGATIETNSVEAVKAVLKTTKTGTVIVSAVVTVKKDGKKATATASKTIKVGPVDDLVLTLPEGGVEVSVENASWRDAIQLELTDYGLPEDYLNLYTALEATYSDRKSVV